MESVVAGVKTIFRLIYLVTALGLVALVILFFGKPILEPFLVGADNINFISLASWLAKWFPRIPFWYPQQGAGVSFTVSYPILSHLLVVIISKLSSLPLLIAFRIFALSSVFLTSLGIYFLAVRMTKNQTVAALAALFYPLSPITWTFLLGWGFFAEQASYLFIPPTIIFLDIYLTEVSSSRKSVLRRLSLWLFLFFSALMLFTHPSSLIGVLTLLAPFLVIYFLVLRAKDKKRLLRTSFITGAILVVFIGLALLFWLVPFSRYRRAVREEGPQARRIYSKNFYKQNAIYFKNFFNLSTELAGYKSADDPAQAKSGVAWRNVVFPFVVSLFALVGLGGCFFLNKKLFALGLANLLPLTLALWPDLAFILRQVQLPLLTHLASWRAMIIPSRIVIPLLAGFGAYTLAVLIGLPLSLVIKRIKVKLIGVSLKVVLAVLTAMLTLVITGMAIYYFKNWPDNPPYLISYGPEAVVKAEMFDLRDVWGEKDRICVVAESAPEVKDNLFCQNEALKERFWGYQLNRACDRLRKTEEELPANVASLCQGNAPEEIVEDVWAECQKATLSPILEEVCEVQVVDFWIQVAPKNWFKFKPSLNLDILRTEKVVIDSLPEDPQTRIDIGTNLGGVIMALPYYRSTFELPVYFNQSSLINTMWNYQMANFYNPDSIWLQPQILDELARYFGMEYVLLSEKLVTLSKYRSESWERVKKIGENLFGEVALWRYKDPTGLVTATTKPLVLVIGQGKVDAYFRIFHLGNIGGLSYDEAILVKGGERVEDYSIDELSRFEAIILDGYRYENRRKAWSLLNQYLKQGGSLYLNTGWQYSSADWELKQTPEFFPLTQLEWTDVGKTSEYALEDKVIGAGVTSTQFSPLIYRDIPWGISSTERSNLRNWAKVILSARNKPLVVGGQYGEGRIIWTGLDLPGHIGSYDDNPEEIKLFHNLMAYLLPDKGRKEVQLGWTREYPDKVEFKFLESSDEKTAVYWREAYYQDFQAKLLENGKTEKIPHYRAGPGLTLFILPSVSQGTKIVYEYKTPVVVQLARIVSLATLIGVLVNVFWPFRVFSDRVLSPRFIGFKHHFSKIFTNEEDKEAEAVF